MVGWMLTVPDLRGWVTDLIEPVGFIASKTTPRLGSIGRSAPRSMLTNSAGFWYDSFEDACLDAMVAAELWLKGDCDALGEMNCPLAVISGFTAENVGLCVEYCGYRFMAPAFGVHKSEDSLFFRRSTVVTPECFKSATETLDDLLMLETSRLTPVESDMSRVILRLTSSCTSFDCKVPMSCIEFPESVGTFPELDCWDKHEPHAVSALAVVSRRTIWSAPTQELLFFVSSADPRVHMSEDPLIFTRGTVTVPEMLEGVLMLEVARLGTLGSDMSRDVLRSAPDCDDLDCRISID